jgi:hypothetical protein
VRVARCAPELIEDDLYKLHLELSYPEKIAPRIKSTAAPKTQSGLIASCACIETFTRTESQTLGDSELNGRQWQDDPDFSMGTDYLEGLSVDGTKGIVDSAGAGASNELFLWEYINVEGVQNRHFEMIAKLRADGGRISTGSGDYLGEATNYTVLGVSHDPDYEDVAKANANVYLRLADDASNRHIKGHIHYGQEGVTHTNSGEVELLTWANDTTTEGPWFWIRLWVSHNTGRLRVWWDADPEPSTWAIDYDQMTTNDYEASSELVNRFQLITFVDPDFDTPCAWMCDYIEVISGLWCCTYSPASGQWFGEEEVGYADGVSTVYNIPISSSYVPGTLRVWVDGLEQTAAILESSPTTGEFTFTFTPESSELITASWRVA